MNLSRRSLALAFAVTLPLGGGAGVAYGQEAACKPLYDAALKALDQPGLERKVSVTNEDGSKLSMDTRKTEAGWFGTSNGGEWFSMQTSPEQMERQLLKDPKSFLDCKLTGTEDLDGEAAQVWTYASTLGGDKRTAKIWVSVARQLPLRVESGTVVQTSSYRDTPYPKP